MSAASATANKRRKPDVHTDEEPESEEEAEKVNPYPLEGKYKDEEDRERLLSMPEIEREEILAQRLEEMQRNQDKRNLEQMLRAQRNGGVESDSVARAAKRQHTGRGATKEKSRKLDELKARRKAKDERKRTNGSPKRQRSSSPTDMEMSSEEEEEGMISKQEQEEERERKYFDQKHPDDEPITLEDLEKCRLSRDLLAKHYLAPWFEDYIKGAWVRYLIGDQGGQPVYRICEITNLGANLTKPYPMNNQMVNQLFELRHSKATKEWPMDRTSNSAFMPHEFERLLKTCEADKWKLPTKRQLQKKIEQLAKLPAQPKTESDISAMLARKSQLNANRPSAAALTMERSRLTQARTLALRRQDYKEVQEIDVQLKALAVTADSHHREEDAQNDIMAKVNERNRKANMEAVRKAEFAESERKRRERKLALQSKSGTSTPVLAAKTSQGTPLAVSSLAAMDPSSRDVSPLPPSALPGQEQTAGTKSKSFAAQVLNNIEIDLGDF
ncbi:plus-3-domain-containing protein [Neolentinus lepideus HHB14362 ss-1]|uniref:Plus-3-domain-containing protein n=1 Tax=Neolentinus lepideus HHB14362 ss-1 TaxID=1314782 RepID=A0A165UKC5_9AGAM|nr:plus-3-domain-containing protein [Neolentinus lepideus HHB14362 ss-1]